MSNKEISEEEKERRSFYDFEGALFHRDIVEIYWDDAATNKVYLLDNTTEEVHFPFFSAWNKKGKVPEFIPSIPMIISPDFLNLRMDQWKEVENYGPSFSKWIYEFNGYYSAVVEPLDNNTIKYYVGKRRVDNYMLSMEIGIQGLWDSEHPNYYGNMLVGMLICEQAMDYIQSIGDIRSVWNE